MFSIVLRTLYITIKDVTLVIVFILEHCGNIMTSEIQSQEISSVTVATVSEI